MLLLEISSKACMCNVIGALLVVASFIFEDRLGLIFSWLIMGLGLVIRKGDDAIIKKALGDHRMLIVMLLYLVGLFSVVTLYPLFYASLSLGVQMISVLFPIIIVLLISDIELCASQGDSS